MKLLSLDALLGSATQTLIRFPLTLLCSASFTILSIYLVDYRGEDNSEFFVRIITVFVLGLAATLAVDLIAERTAPAQKTFFRLGIVAFLAIYYVTLPEKLILVNYARYTLWLLGFHLLVAFAPYFPPRQINGFWQYNQLLFIRILTAILYSGVLFLGISAALVAIRQLFGVEIEASIFAKLWIFLIGIFNTWFFLADVPRDFEALEADSFYPLPLKLFTQYVLLPLVTLYLLILYAYEIKILLEWNLPKGWVTYLIIAFAIGGIFSFLLIYPLRETANNQWISVFERWFHLAMLPLLALLFVAIGRRIWDYGFTELRYFVLTLALWLTGISLYFLISKVKNIQYIPISLAIVAFGISFGPWGAFSVSSQSQLSRFKYYFAQHTPLQAGKIAQAQARKTMPDSIQNEVTSIIGYFYQKGEMEVLQSAFAENLDSLFKKDKNESEKRASLIALLGKKGYKFEYASPEEAMDAKNFYFSSQNNTGEEVRGFDYLLNINDSNKEIKVTDNQTFSTQIDRKNYTIQVLSNEKAIISIDFRNLIEKLLQNYREKPYETPKKAMILEQKNDKCQIRLRFNSLNVRADKSQLNTLDSFDAILLIKLNTN